MSTAFHPESDGQTERMNRVLEETLRHYVNARQSNWCELLPMAEFAINNSWNESVQNTPFFLNYGQHPQTPMSVSSQSTVPNAVRFTETMQKSLQLAKQYLQQAQDRQKKYADQKRAPVQYQIGQQVLLSSKNLRVAPGLAKKLLPKWVGPFQIERTIEKRGSTVAVQLALPMDWKLHDVFHVALIRPYRSDGTVQPPLPAQWVADEPLYTVDRILDHRFKRVGRKSCTEFLVKWKDAPSENNSWEPEDSLTQQCSDLIEQYWSMLPEDQAGGKRKRETPVETPRTKSTRRKFPNPRFAAELDPVPPGGEDLPEGEEV
jgi:hypothetical protein